MSRCVSLVWSSCVVGMVCVYFVWGLPRCIVRFNFEHLDLEFCVVCRVTRSMSCVVDISASPVSAMRSLSNAR